MKVDDMLLFVPLKFSLSDDAPGYNNDAERTIDNETKGPLCWKCDGTGINKRPKEGQELSCKVCKGVKRLPAKIIPFSKKQKCLNRTEDDIAANLIDGEQLCGLVGGWSIIQRLSGHRWTTDDIVTAWVAVNAHKIIIPLINNTFGGNSSVGESRYLDLGCGNGSVLLMVSRNLPVDSLCVGIEARSEAVALARRSIAFNFEGSHATETDRKRSITVHNKDFRQLYTTEDQHSPNASCSTHCINDTDFPPGILFDLVTGTPPYFRVNFSVDPTSQEVQQALIQQGSMPSCKESAPARCEFRGGIEAYCEAAAKVLSPTGVFTVCVNYLNHERALFAADQANLHVYLVQKVVGKEGKSPLFCVYAMVHKSLLKHLHQRQTEWVAQKTEETAADGTIDEVKMACEKLLSLFSVECIEQPDLVVRDLDGAWTPTYADMLREVGYPVRALHPSGKY